MTTGQPDPARTRPMSSAGPPEQLTMRTPEDALAAVPVILDFEPSESLVVMTFGGTSTFHARIDLPPPGDERSLELILDQVVAPALAHRVSSVVIVVYAADQEWAATADLAATAAFDAAHIAVKATVRTDGERWWAPGWPGQTHRSAAGTRYDSSVHRFRAQTVLRGNVVHGSREDLAAMLEPVLASVAAVRAARLTARAIAAARVADLVVTGVAAGRLDDADLADLLLSLRRPMSRDAAWAHLDRSSAEAHLRFWIDVVQRSPADLVADAAAVLALTAWLAGHGALAWCAIERCRTFSPDHSLARLVDGLLTGAVAPVAWDEMHPRPAARHQPTLRLVTGI